MGSAERRAAAWRASMSSKAAFRGRTSSKRENFDHGSIRGPSISLRGPLISDRGVIRARGTK
jgi:hypothetical protein